MFVLRIFYGNTRHVKMLTQHLIFVILLEETLSSEFPHIREIGKT